MIRLNIFSKIRWMVTIVLGEDVDIVIMNFFNLLFGIDKF
jgi:hypothetical protein